MCSCKVYETLSIIHAYLGIVYLICLFTTNWHPYLGIVYLMCLFTTNWHLIISACMHTGHLSIHQCLNDVSLCPAQSRTYSILINLLIRPVHITCVVARFTGHCPQYMPIWEQSIWYVCLQPIGTHIISACMHTGHLSIHRCLKSCVPVFGPVLHIYHPRQPSDQACPYYMHSCKVYWTLSTIHACLGIVYLKFLFTTNSHPYHFCLHAYWTFVHPPMSNLCVPT